MLASEPCHVSEQSIDMEEAISTPKDTSKDVPTIGWKNWLNLVAYVVNSVVTYTSLTGIYGETNTELSNRYQTLVTPSGWAFSIWGPIFIWEAVFVVAQFFPRFRQSTAVLHISPWWWGLCTFQTVWTLVFAQDWVTFACVLMLGILVCLLGVAWSTDGEQMSAADYFLLRAPLSLHLGWIIVASTLSVNVQADALSASQETLLALAVLSSALVLAVVTAFTLAVKSPDPIIGLVAAWAFAAISSELSNPVKLNDPARFNPSTWDMVTLGGLQKAALGTCVLSAAMAVAAAGFRILAACRSDAKIEIKQVIL